MNQDDFRFAANITPSLAARWFIPLTDTMNKFGIDTGLRQAAFIAQIGTESAGFTRLSESFNYSVVGLSIFGNRLTAAQREQLGRKEGEPALSPERQMAIANIVYGGRYGNQLAGDGWRYRGRGLKQVTFHDNYLACGQKLHLDLVADPDLLLEDVNAAQSAGWFWDANDCNAFADLKDMLGLTKRINGGTNGLNDRQARYQTACKVLL
ncbi:glycoside hydrolase family 19 protein [Sodalis ligni]|jgi:putative chitinase|uniref:Putative chitinase n=1 Tax=Sodalis ligni TaxID=2697027 RepID=A0A4R1NG97_9GAMM|nr:glycoside hydrolase family 19 protein [Sodalis ligni]QWA09920.1 glycoside hydrolase family 19 protein [Sodalis ligni]TCL06705.1 putative chitinase [Sodalis ligni]